MFLPADEDLLSPGYRTLMFLLCSDLDYTLYKMPDSFYLQEHPALLRSPPDPLLQQPWFPLMPNP